jgi:polysaccharide export outer membrane protein
MEINAMARNHVLRAMRSFTLLCLLTGCSTPALSPPPATSNKAPDPYVIGIADLLEIRVWKHEELEVRAPVRSDGKIAVPLIDAVQAEGLTPERLKDVVSKKLSLFLKNPDVTVTVISPDSQMVTVIGAVLRSGQIPLTHKMGALEAVAAAGGFNPWANKGDVRVIRWVRGERVAYGFDYHAYVKGELDSDVLLQPGDVVVVPE